MKVNEKTIYLVLLVPLYLSAHDISLHMKITAETFDVWQEFDPAFYQRMITPAQTLEDSVLKMKTYKFYYIGAILPDLFWQHAQSSIRSLINILYEERSNLTDPLYIHTYTKNSVQTAIEFPAGTNSHNLEKLYQMVNYARNSNWSAYEKSMIYGAYLHAVQDMYANFMQASRFGYGKCYDSDSAVRYNILRYGELYHELFSQTHMPSSWVNFLAPLFCEVADPNGMAKLRYGSCCFYREYTIDGNYFLGWQQLYFTPIQKYVEASNAVGWQVANLSHDRLRSYLHGWAIATFMLYGYKRDGTCAGGMFSHPDWSIDYLVDEFWYDIGSYYYEPWWLGILPNSVQNWLKRSAWENMGIREWLKQAFGSYPWPQYFEHSDKLEELWNSVPDSLKTPEAQQEYYGALENLRSWQDTPGNQILEPRKRTSYSTEASLAVEFKDFYKNSVNQGPAYLDLKWNNLKVYTTARKAGLLGGLYDISSEAYSRQPGIIDLHYYAINNNEHEHVYTTVVTEETPYGGIEWDVFVFPQKMHIRLMGRKSDGTIFQIGSPFQYNIYDIERKQGYLETDLDNVVLEGAEEIFWEILTFNPYNNSHLMLKADYRGVYQQSSLVYDNILYQRWFKGGDPTRNKWQNPLTDPLRYWPSVLRLFGLNKPTDFTFSYVNSTQEKLQWTDKSNREAGFQIARKKDNEEWDMNYDQVGAAPGSGATVEYIDTVTLCHKYVYKVKAYDNEGRSSEWTDSVVNVHGSLAQSNYLKMSAFNSNRKVMCGPDDNIHMIYYNGDSIYYSHSTNNGISFAPWETVCRSDTIPALVLDNDGVPYVAYGVNVQVGGSPPYRIKYYVGRRTDSGWEFTYHPIFSSGPTYSTTLPCPPSIVLTNDSGYVAFRDNVTNTIKVSSFILPLSGYPNSVQITQCAYSPVIGYDRSGRLVLVVHEGLFGPLKLYYRSIGSSTWESVSITEFPYDAAFGAPSLWAETARLYITAEGDDVLSPTGASIYYCYLKWDKIYDMIYIAYPTTEVNNKAEGLNPPIITLGQAQAGNDPVIITGGKYEVKSVEKVGFCDWDNIDGIEGYSYLASKDLVLWKYEDNIWFSRRVEYEWTNPQDLSNTYNISSFPQGVIFTSEADDKLLSVWTEHIDDDYYLIREIIEYDGTSTPGGGPQATNELTTGTFYLENIYPNPTNRVLKIRFNSPDERKVTVKLYDITGRLIENVFDGKAKVGMNEILVKSENMAAGIYFISLNTDGCEKVEKITILK